MQAPPAAAQALPDKRLGLQLPVSGGKIKLDHLGPTISARPWRPALVAAPRTLRIGPCAPSRPARLCTHEQTLQIAPSPARVHPHSLTPLPLCVLAVTEAGELQRIADWQTYTPTEQERIAKRIHARNKVRAVLSVASVRRDDRGQLPLAHRELAIFGASPARLRKKLGGDLHHSRLRAGVVQLYLHTWPVAAPALGSRSPSAAWVAHLLVHTRAAARAARGPQLPPFLLQGPSSAHSWPRRSQERLDKLRAAAQEVDAHDSSLRVPPADASGAEQALLDRKEHLDKFVESLQGLKERLGGAAIPGLENLESQLLQPGSDERRDGAPRVSSAMAEQRARERKQQAASLRSAYLCVRTSVKCTCGRLVTSG